ncbi:MAG: c-type cytochrome [Rhodocyclaceae bacterium]
MKRQMVFSALAVMLAAGASAAHAWNPERGKELSAVCAACHGADGTSPVPDFPNIGGQYEKYLYRALLDYKLGNRKNPIMAAQVEALSRADMRDLAAYYASQEGLYLKR